MPLTGTCTVGGREIKGKWAKEVSKCNPPPLTFVMLRDMRTETSFTCKHPCPQHQEKLAFPFERSLLLSRMQYQFSLLASLHKSGVVLDMCIIRKQQEQQNRVLTRPFDWTFVKYPFADVLPRACIYINKAFYNCTCSPRKVLRIRDAVRGTFFAMV